MIANKYKVYKNKEHFKKLSILCNSSAYIWNHVTLLHDRHYKIYGKGVSKKRMRQQISKLRKNNDYWKKLNSQTVQEIVDRVYSAYERFFLKISKRPPKLKKVSRFSSFVLTQSGWSLKNNKFTINKVVTIKFSKSREYFDIKNIRIKRDSVGDWWIIILSSKKIENFKDKKTHKGAFVGFDFSINKFIIGSDGSCYDSRVLHIVDKQISKLNKSISRKEPNSKNRNKEIKKLARLHRTICFKRKEYHWKLSHELCSKYSFISIETLNIEKMKKRWGQKINNLGFVSFIKILKHVSIEYDTVIHEIDKWFPSSKTCYSCGFINKELKLSDREWLCNNCQTKHERDLTASKNILRQGIVEYNSRNKTNKIASYDEGK